MDFSDVLQSEAVSGFEKILEEGQITSRDDVLAYEISEDAYSELANLFDKTT